VSTISVEDIQLLEQTRAGMGANPSAEYSATMRNRLERILTGIEVLVDWLTVVVAVSSGYTLYHFLHLGRQLHYSIAMLATISSAVAVLFVILLDRDGAYSPGSSLLRVKETERSLRVSAQTFLLILPITFFGGFVSSRLTFLIALLCVPLLQAIEKQLMFVAVRAMRARGVGVQRVLIYGAGHSGRRVFSALVRSPKLGFNPVALIDDNPELAGQVVFEYAYRHEHSASILSGPITRDLLIDYQCSMLVVAIPNLAREKFTEVVQAALEARVRLAFVPVEIVTDEYVTEHADIDGIMLSMLCQPAKMWHYDLTKRAFDLFVGLGSLLLLLPVCLAVAVLVRLDSRGPVLFRQQRVGKNGKLFNLYKFRSMYAEAPKYDFSPTDSSDPRITRIGRFLRRTSLDELPQLLNVVKGDMSMVGPRPEMPFIVKQYNAVHRQRLHVTPGITGLWQLSADRAFLIHENIQYDLYYIRHRSYFMDFAILLHTVVFAMRGV
jgi:exopolysaccharide biosynthesis polyprenyl glycosylphosphotransferase